ncbi:MAG: glycoside hydrolase family 43 protein [Clostridiales bacterium]|nr:glycoside hydrolase family 43 protein [Clostridiales bacterium]
MKKMLFALCLVLLSVCACALGEEAAPPKFKNANVHDPSVILADDGYFYIYGSHMAAARSQDLMSWETISRNAESGCKLFEDVQTELQEALFWARTATFWASDVQQLADGRYYLYYCTCEGSSPLSALGLAVSDRPEGPYQNLGIFLKSGMEGYDATQLPNVIDPHTFYDKDGKLWMVYGSYSGGIFILEMDENTGFPLEGQGYGKKLLGKNHARIEAPYILYSEETDYYYLFLSFGGLNANDGYNIRVCRSKNPDGPYVDALGQDMIDCGGSDGSYFNDPDYAGYGVKLMGGHQWEPYETDNSKKATGYKAPGHNSAWYDAETERYFLIFHTRFVSQGERYSVRVHQFYMNDAGWPVVSPLRYAGEMIDPVAPQNQTGVYKVILHERDINLDVHASKIVMLNTDGSVTGDLSGIWRSGDGVKLTLTLEGTTYDGVIQAGYDESQKVFTTGFTALDETGAAVWGVRAANQP